MKHHRFTNSTGTIRVADTDSGGDFRSKLERHGFIHWVSQLDVVLVRLQEPRITYLDETGKKRRYTGDLLVHFHPRVCRRPLVVECKYAANLERDPELVKKLKRVGEAMRRLDRDFMIQTEHDIHTSEFKMLKFVFGHRNNDVHPAQQEIMDCMSLHKQTTLGELLNALRTDILKQCALIPEVWRLVAMHKLTVNFNEVLNHTVKISLPSV